MEIEKDVPSCIIHEMLAPPLQYPFSDEIVELIQHAIEFHNSGQYQV